MNREEVHALVDEIFDAQAGGAGVSEITFTETPEEPKRELPEGKRVVRTKSTGDRVYFIDDVAKTKQWVTSPQILEQLGFALTDVQDVEDSSLIGFQMQASIYKVDEN